MADTLDSLSATYKDKEPFLWAACEYACRNIGQPANRDEWLALVSEVQKLVNEHMWETKYYLILHILEQCANNIVDNDRPSSTTLFNLYRPSLLSSTPASSYHKRHEPHEDAVSVVSDRSSTLPDGSLNLQFKNSGSLSDSAMWSFSLQNSILIACMEDVSYNNIIRSSIAARASLQIDELDEDDHAVIAKDSHLSWANSVSGSIKGKTLIDWRPAGCWRTISTQVYVTNHADAPDMSAGKNLMNEVAEHRKSLKDSISHILHHKRQNKTETSRPHHTDVTQNRFRTGAVRDSSFNHYESYSRSQQLSIPDNPRQASTEMGQQTSHSDSDLPPQLLQSQHLDPSGHPKLKSSVPDLLLHSSVPHGESLDQRGETSTHRRRVPEAVYHCLQVLIIQIPLLVIFWWMFIRS